MSHIEDMEKSIEEVSAELKKQITSGSEDVCLMGNLADMLKDLAEAKYKCVITKAMKDAEEEDEMLAKLDALDDGRRGYNSNRYNNGQYAPKGRGSRIRGYDEPMYYYDERIHREPMYYTPMYYTTPSYRDTDRRDYGRMYYTDGNMSSGNASTSNSSGSNQGSTMGYSESRYDRARRSYTESQDIHSANTQQDKEAKMKELENYMKELSGDVSEMMNKMSPEERALAKSKLSTLITKM